MDGSGERGFGPLPDRYSREWERHHKSLAALAGIEWKILMDSFREASAELDRADYLELRYEDLCREPAGRIREVTDF